MGTTLHTLPAEAAKVAANWTAAGNVAVPDVRLLTLVDLLAEAFIANLMAANDNAAPNGE